MSKPLRAAVIECGALTHSAHLPTLHRSELFELVVACDRNPAAAEAARERWEGRTHRNRLAHCRRRARC